MPSAALTSTSGGPLRYSPRQADGVVSHAARWRAMVTHPMAQAALVWLARQATASQDISCDVPMIRRAARLLPQPNTRY
jgi:hypothetical protein